MNISESHPPHAKPLQKAIVAGITASLIGISAELYAQEIEEVVVTARKKTETLQDAAITIQAVTEATLDEQNIDVFSDYIRYLPNATAGGRGPGQNEMYIRGAAVDGINITVTEAQGSAPNVALYLDEQPVTAGGRNLDVYAADLTRIEVLPGPQGTLYGSSSQAGTVRLITNKPELDVTAFSFNASTSVTSGGEPSNSVEGVFNLPVMDGKMAIRGVLFNDNAGGYIDNVEETFIPDPRLNPRLPSAEGVMFVEPGGDPMSHEFADGSYAEPGKTYEVKYTPFHNQDLAEDNFNDASYSGFRVGASYVINDSWDLLVQHHQQRIQSEGVFDYDEEYGDLKVARFHPDDLDDAFGQTSWTLQGRLDQLDLIYTGAYLAREVNHFIDYTEYTNVGGYIPGYLCEYNTPGYHGGGGVGYTFDPTLSGESDVIECAAGNGGAVIDNENSRFTHEIRVNGSFSNTFGYTAGVFYQDRTVKHIGDFNYGSIDWPQLDPARISRHTANSLEVKGPRTQFVNDITRPEKELALFGELSINLTEQLELILGLRNYDIEVGFEGFSAFRYGSRPVPNLIDELGPNGVDPVGIGGRDYIDNLGDFQPFKINDTIGRVGFAWHQSSNLLIYGTYSQGYRPPGFNRAAAAGQATAAGVAARGNDGPGGFPDYFIPVFYLSDSLDNFELGWKSTANKRRWRWNGAFYRLDWNNIQVSHFDSQNISIFTIVDNGGDAEVTGIETDFELRATDNLSLFGGVSVNRTELIAVNPTFAFVVADIGSELPLTPQLQMSGRARYSWDSRFGQSYFQIGGNYAGKSWNSLVDIPQTDPRKEQEAYVILDTALGVENAEGWRLEGFIQNLTNERAQLHINRLDFKERISTNRPRTIGFRLGYDF